jgi:Alr-MurF fusion protein
MLSTTYSSAEIAKVLKGELIGCADENSQIRQLVIDSRKLISPDQSLFFALVTKRNDGHKYIEELYEKGVRNFVISNKTESIDKCPDANFILVKNSLFALQQLAAYHRKKFTLPVVGITGSNGKTIVKEWLYQLMNEDKKIVRSPKSYNSQVGVPLSVWQFEPEHELALIEAGISEIDEMDKLQAVIQPTIGIFTNIGQAHDENFVHTIQKVSEKLKLFTKVKLLIFCADHLEIKERINHAEVFRNLKTFTWGQKAKSDLQIISVTRQLKYTLITATYLNNTIQITIPFTDDASVENAMHCWAFMLSQGYSNEIITERMHNLSPVAMRLELKEGINNCSVINDSYNSDLNSLSIAIDFLNQQKQHRKRTVILSDILQSGKNEDELYTEVAELLSSKKIDSLIGIGKSISRQKDKFKIEKVFYPSTADFMREYSLSDFHNETILLKGARIFRFEQIGKALQQKAHETVLEINLNGLISNLNYYRSLLKPDTKLMAMVKAFSYGSGSYEIANVLQYHQVDYMTVAYTDEGVELRKAGITTPIMVMNPEEQSFYAMLKYDLEPEIYSFRILNLFEEALERYASIDKNAFVHIKLDTGMHRLGFEDYELDELIGRIKKNPRIIIKSLFSHLAASDDAKHDDFTHEQFERFKTMSKIIQDNFDYPIMRHILNSAGISRFKDAQFEMVRLGIGLYGVAANETEQALLQNVSTLKTVISQIKKIKTGESIGYGRNWVAKRETIIATLPIGYADGLSRKLGNGKGSMYVNGYFAPIAGNICMDMCMLDITEIPANEGDDVIVFGNEYPIAKFAADMETIPYEVLTSVSRRVKRVYFQE